MERNAAVSRLRQIAPVIQDLHPEVVPFLLKITSLGKDAICKELVDHVDIDTLARNTQILFDDATGLYRETLEWNEKGVEICMTLKRRKGKNSHATLARDVMELFTYICGLRQFPIDVLSNYTPPAREKSTHTAPPDNAQLLDRISELSTTMDNLNVTLQTQLSKIECEIQGLRSQINAGSHFVEGTVLIPKPSDALHNDTDRGNTITRPEAPGHWGTRSATISDDANGVARQQPERDADRQRDTSPQRHTSRVKRATNVIASHGNRKAKQRMHPPRPVEDNKETMVIGTSMVRGQGPLLNKAGVNACCYTNPGCLIPQIAPRLLDLVKEVKPAQIVIHCGGNDLEREDAVTVFHKYVQMIDSIRAHSSSSDIILSTIAPRKQNARLNRSIISFNNLLRRLADSADKLYYAECAPIGLSYYTKDKVHFNARGKWYFARKLAETVKKCVNFPKLFTRDIT